ncbi:MAG: hypothetical protein M1834_006528 [Cirrosporium novae-zelandiae]|nr:MAG: hypothetical protein M1834_006528 [Cirrosporium novae-zelandiae]
MNPKSTNAKSTLDILPMEVRQAIMSALSDVRSLISMVLACSAFYQAFNDAQLLITSRVLLNETLSDALSISKLYDHIHYFAADFASKSLACVHDYLFRAVSPAFNEIVEHDIQWGEFRINYADMSDPEDIEPILARGLSSIHSIVLANTYEDRYQLLYPDYPQHADNFLYEALSAANELDDSVYLEEYTTDDELSQIRSPFFQDPDTGPADVWRWAHQEESCDLRQPLREWAYVMWNRSRLDQMNIFQTPWDEPAELTPTHGDVQQRDQRQASLDWRSEIYWGGGRGWWSFEDESRIVWPDRKGVVRHPLKGGQKEVKSLSEARDLILSLKYPSAVDGP